MELSGTEIIYASKARTLMDAVYDWSRFEYPSSIIDTMERIKIAIGL